jgi:hypothetical protein
VRLVLEEEPAVEASKEIGFKLRYPVGIRPLKMAGALREARQFSPVATLRDHQRSAAAETRSRPLPELERFSAQFGY